MKAFMLAAAVAIALMPGCRRAPKSLRVGYSATLPNAAVIIGVADGNFSRAGGVPIRASVYPAGPATIEALLHRDIDIAYVGPVAAVSAFTRSKGRYVVIAGAAANGAALVAAPTSPARTSSDLRDARVATPHAGSTQDVAARFHFGDLGFTSYEHGGNFKIVPTPNNEMLNQFAAGDIDAAWTVEPWVTQLIEQGGARLILDEADLWATAASTGIHPTSMVVARKTLIKSHPEIVTDFLRLHAGEIRWINENPKRAQQIFESAMARLTRRPFAPGVMARAWDRVHFSTDVLAQGIVRCADQAFRVGFMGGDPLELEELIDEGPLKRATVAAVNSGTTGRPPS